MLEVHGKLLSTLVTNKMFLRITEDLRKHRDWNNACKSKCVVYSIFMLSMTWSAWISRRIEWMTLAMYFSRYPHASCSYVGPLYNSHCLQKHNYVRMVAYSPQDGLHIDSFRLPIACSCHLGQTRLPNAHTLLNYATGKSNAAGSILNLDRHLRT
jgi:hypothetical protein